MSFTPIVVTVALPDSLESVDRPSMVAGEFTVSSRSPRVFRLESTGPVPAGSELGACFKVEASALGLAVVAITGARKMEPVREAVVFDVVSPDGEPAE